MRRQIGRISGEPPATVASEKLTLTAAWCAPANLEQEFARGALNGVTYSISISAPATFYRREKMNNDLEEFSGENAMRARHVRLKERAKEKLDKLMLEKVGPLQSDIAMHEKIIAAIDERNLSIELTQKLPFPLEFNNNENPVIEE